MSQKDAKAMKNRVFRQNKGRQKKDSKKNIAKLLQDKKFFMYFGFDFRKTYNNYEKNFHPPYYCFGFCFR